MFLKSGIISGSSVQHKENNQKKNTPPTTLSPPPNKAVPGHHPLSPTLPVPHPLPASAGPLAVACTPEPVLNSSGGRTQAELAARAGLNHGKLFESFLFAYMQDWEKRRRRLQERERVSSPGGQKRTPSRP